MWTFLDEAADPSVIRAGGLVVAGSEVTPAVCEVVDVARRRRLAPRSPSVLPGLVAER